VYWEGGAYLGLGNGAHSFAEPLRRWNVRDWDDYARRARAGGLAVAGEETVVGEARRLERVWLGLRTDRGIPWGDLTERARALAARWIGSGWALRDAGGVADRLRLTAEGWLLLDRLAVELDGALAPAAPAATTASRAAVWAEAAVPDP
jgi:oxygen-independent coproporphyrinogen-3 oxidase